jgi:hypothetical protein
VEEEIQAWWHMPEIPALGRMRQGQPGLHSETPSQKEEEVEGENKGEEEEKEKKKSS